MSQEAERFRITSRLDWPMRRTWTLLGPDGKPFAGARVFVANWAATREDQKVLATSGDDGRFRVRVPAAPDKTSVTVAIRDASGHETTRTVPCGSTAMAHIKDFAIRWRKKGP
jgi:hypothetical protein